MNFIQCLIDENSALAAGPARPPAITVEAKTYQVSGSERHISFEDAMLGSITDIFVASMGGLSQHTDRPATGFIQAQ